MKYCNCDAHWKLLGPYVENVMESQVLLDMLTFPLRYFRVCSCVPITQIFRILIGLYSRGVHVSIGILLGYLLCTRTPSYYIELCYVQVEKDANLRRMHLARRHAIPHQIILNHDFFAIKSPQKNKI